MNYDFRERKRTRWEGFDYNSAGAYFITICTQNRRQILSTIVGCDVLDAPKTVLLHHGAIADKYLQQLSDFYDYLEVDQYVIMPNHIHIMLIVYDHEDVSATKQHSAMSRFISTFKRFCNKEYGENIWQYRSNDHIIRNRQDHEEHLRYIYENPIRWYCDELYTDE